MSRLCMKNEEKKKEKATKTNQHLYIAVAWSKKKKIHTKGEMKNNNSKQQ